MANYTPPTYDNVNLQVSFPVVPPAYDSIVLQTNAPVYLPVGTAILEQTYTTTEVGVYNVHPIKYATYLQTITEQEYHLPDLVLHDNRNVYVDNVDNQYVDTNANVYRDVFNFLRVTTYAQQSWFISTTVAPVYITQHWKYPLHTAVEQVWSLTPPVYHVGEHLYQLVVPLLNVSVQQYMDVLTPTEISVQPFNTAIQELRTYVEKPYTTVPVASSFNEELWSIFSTKQRTAEQPWFLSAVPPVLVTEQHWNITLTAGHVAYYEIKQPVEAAHLAKYIISDVNAVSASHVAKYDFVQSGLLGISDRYLSSYHAWDTELCDRTIHLHLFNTFLEDRSITYEQYYVSYCQALLVLTREMILDERDVVFGRYSENISEQNIRTSSFEEHTDERDVSYPSVDEYYSEIETILSSEELDIPSDRTGFCWCVDNTFRYCYAKSWHVSEFWCITHAKEKDIIADQRVCVVQTEQHLYSTIRTMMFEYCCLSYDFTINPSYVELFSRDIDLGVGGTGLEVVLFENERVIPDTNTFYTLPINFESSGVDLLLLEKDAEVPIYCGSHAIVFQDFLQATSNTYRYDGHIIPMKDVTFVKLVFEFSDTGILTDDEYFAYLVSHGYFKVILNGEPMTQNESIVADVPATMLVPFVIEVYGPELDKSNVNISLTWAYPYQSTRVHTVLIVGRNGTV